MPNNYHFFGCSWTCVNGMRSDYSSHVQFLADRYPDDNFYNWGVGGSSIALSCYILDQVKQKYNGKFIFQATSKARLSSWEDDFDFTQRIVQSKDNYYALPGSLWQTKWTGMTSRHAPYALQKLYNQYYAHRSIDSLKYEHKVYINYAVARSDFAYAQIDDRLDLDIPVLQRVFGKRYKKYTKAGDGSHFGREGLIATADWIAKEFIDASK